MRPTSDRVKAAIFSTIGDKVSKSSFLDIFSGTGSIGIEAYSRGASFISFFDYDLSLVKNNVRLLDRGTFSLIEGDFFRVNISGKFDIIYLDPPYDFYDYTSIMKRLSTDILKDNGVIIFEGRAKHKFDPLEIPYIIDKQRSYGDTLVTYFSKE